MKPIRHPLVPGPGHRTLLTLLHLTVRDLFLRAAAEIHCNGMSDRQAAEWLHQRLARYRETAWQRDRVAEQCPQRLYGRVNGLLWAALKCSDNVPSPRTLRRKLSPVYSWPTV